MPQPTTDRNGTGDQPGGAFISRREMMLGGAAVVAVSAVGAGCARSRPMVHSDDSIAPTDPALLKYTQVEQVDIEIPDPTGISVGPDGSLWVAGSRVVARLQDPAGPDRSGRPGLPAQIEIAGDATCITATSGALFIGVGPNVEVARPQMTRTETWATLGAEGHITCIAVGSEAVYLADAVSRRVARCDTGGRILGYLAEKDPKRDYSGLIVPSPHLDVVVGEDDSVHIVNPGLHQIEIYDPDGSPRWSWGEESQEADGFCGCCNPTDIALLPGGDYVTAEKGIPRVKVYSANGHFEGMVVGHEGLSQGVVGLDIAAYPDGRIAVLDRGIKAVRVFQRTEAGRA